MPGVEVVDVVCRGDIGKKEAMKLKKVQKKEGAKLGPKSKPEGEFRGNRNCLD
ncbi:MAG: hypothetical protein ACOC7P_01710 [Chloroflexota bacterium]